MDIRPIASDEVEAFYSTFFRTMGFGPPSEGQLEREQKNFRPERSLAAFDAGSIVGTTYSHPFELTLPGARQVSAAGVTAVSVASTHRRRGIVTQLMRRQLSEAKERGESAAVLIASEGRIYRRFGYGIASQVCDVNIEVRDAQPDVRPREQGRIVIVDGEAADKIFPAVHDRARRARNGALGRPQHFWESITADRDKRHVHVVYENPSGEPDGYSRYEVRADWKDGLPVHKVTVHELLGCTDAASIGLWSFLIGLDLVREVSAMSRPVDEPLRWTIDEPRAVRTKTLRDMYWLRPLDVPTLLSTRSYNAGVDLYVEVIDDLIGSGGTFHLRGGAEGAECSTSSGAANLRLHISDLGSIALGGIVPTELARAGRIEELTPGALRSADLAFVTYPRPWGDVYF